MKPENLQTFFIQWLRAILADESCRAAIREQLRESDLPVIEFTTDDSE